MRGCRFHILDTVKVNNKSVYPMMSVFKVHQALALCNDFDNKGISLDTLVNIYHALFLLPSEEVQ